VTSIHVSSTRRRTTVRGVAALAAVAAVTTLPVPLAGALACPEEPLTSEECPEPVPPPPPSPPGPIGWQLTLYDSDVTAVPATDTVVEEILGHVEPATRSRFLAVNPRLVVHIIPDGRTLTQVPLWAPFADDQAPGHPPGTTYDDLPGAASPGCTGDVGVREAWITSLPGGPPPEQLNRVMAHEIGHEIQCAGLSAAQNSQLSSLRDAARTRYRDQDPLNDHIVGVDPAYTVFDRGEFFAEATAAWFNMGPPASTYRRQWLRENDERLYDLLDQIYTAAPAPAYCDRQRATRQITTSGQTVTGTFGRDIIVGSSGVDVIEAGGNADVVCGRGGGDTIRGATGNDRILGGGGVDTLEGGNHDDRLVGGLGGDTLHGGDGNDQLLDSLPATPAGPGEPGDGTDTMFGGRNDDLLSGGSEFDFLVDTSGWDTLEGGTDGDLLNSVDATATTVPDTVNAGEEVNICSRDPIDEVFGDCSGSFPGG
jgi:hypothetical protein